MLRVSKYRLSSVPRVLILLAVLVFGAGGVFAPAATAADMAAQDEAFADKVLDWTKTLESVREQLSTPGKRSDPAFQASGAKAERVRDEAAKASFDASNEADAARKLLQALGPAPKEDEPPEAAEIAAQRESLTARVATFEGRMKQADLIRTQASDLIGMFLAASRERLANLLLMRGPSPVLPAVWARAIPDFMSTLTQIVAVPLQWLASGALAMSGAVSLAILATGLFLSALIGWPLRKWLLRKFGRDPYEAEPSVLRRLLAATVEGIARGLLPSLAVAAVYLTFLSLELFSANLAPIAAGACLALVFFIMVSSLAGAALAPNMPQWQLAPFEPANARAISRTITALAAVAAVIIFVHKTVHGIAMTVDFWTVFNFVTDTMIAAGMLFLLQPRLWKRAQAAGEAVVRATSEAAAGDDALAEEILKVRRRVLPGLRWLMVLVAIAIPAASLLGYNRLAGYLTSNLVWSAALIGGLWLLHELLREVIDVLLSRDEKLSPKVRRALTLTERGSRVLQFWSLFGINLVLILFGIAAALPIWGLNWHDLSDWLKSSEFGNYLDRLTFSISDIATAFVVFALIMLATRWLQRALEERIFPQTRLDMGVRHSLKAAVGYIGLLVAVVTAVSALGLNLTNLALVAGALSVGIGFGLQGIVNNFISGLILLIERPIKVGDWVRVGDKEGFVRRISVRSTEIETFQRANVIIPNAELISNSVINLTHRDHLGRIDIPVGVAYGSDVEKVKELLVRCGAQHPNALRSPPPQALLLNFGGSSLDFQLRVHVDRIERYWTIVSDLHYAIEKAFREAGIEIPYQQTDIRLRDLDRLEAMMKGGATPPAGEAEEPPDRRPKKGIA